MAECVISPVVLEEGLVQACVVHTHYAPCPLDGQPANPNPVHVDDQVGRDVALLAWQMRTAQQRPLVLHRGTFADHHDLGGTECWCKPEQFPASDLPVSEGGEGSG